MSAGPIDRRAADVVVVGAGAAGLAAAQFAAAQLANPGLALPTAAHASDPGPAAATVPFPRVLLLEKNQRPGLKILISGGGRCNVTTTRSGADLEQQYGASRGRFLRHALRSFPPTAVRAWIETLGVPLQEEDLEKLFPVSQRARDVLDALVRGAQRAGALLQTGCPVLAIDRLARGFAVTTAGGRIECRALVLATGGRSYAKTGATGDGYPWLRQFGHTITATVPALAPLVVDAAWVRELQGIVLTTAEIAVLDAAGKVVRARRRPILFTHQGLSGPAPMDLAGDVEERAGAVLRLDFAPEVTPEALEAEWLAQARLHGRRAAESVLPRALPERLRAALCALAGVGDATLATWTKTQRQQLVAAVKDLRVACARSRGFDHAEVTRGGLALAEVEPRTMASRLVPGLFVCGELLDVDGPIGGFNFQAAFATGRLAGLAAAAAVQGVEA